MSEAFRPSPEAARAALGASANIVTKDHPGGKEGATISLKDVARRIEQGRKDPRVQGWAGRALVAAGRPKSQKAQAQAILDAFHKQTMYVKDPDGVELIKAAKTTLCLDEHGLCMPAGDCFPSTTKLLREDHVQVPIENIEVGNRIWGYDKWTRIEAKVFKGPLTVDAIEVFGQPNRIELTSDHFVFARRGEGRPFEKIRVRDLKSGLLLMVPEVEGDLRAHKLSCMALVKDVVRNVRTTPCYDIQTEDHYVYLPDHHVTVSNCDDLSVALGSALASVTIPVKVIGQAFGTDLPTHVMIGVETEEGFKKIDPSTDTMKVGNYHMATKEWTLDPLDHAKFMLEGATGGEYVGIGAPGTLGELTDDQKKVLYDTMTFQLQTAVWTLERAVNGLGTALNEIATVRRDTRPDNLFDPEPNWTITSLAEFPATGIWTERMNTIATSLWATGDRLVKAGHEALDGGRTIFVDKVSGDAFIQALTTDPWYLRTIVQKVTDSVIAIYDKGGQIIGGFLSSNGKKLTPAEVQQEMQPGVQGLGAIQAIGPAIVIGTAAMVAIASIGTYFTVAKLCDAAKTYAREATRQDLAKCVTSGKCSQKVFDDVAKQRQQEAENDAKNDPFSKAADKLTNVLTLLAISGAVIGGVVVLAPLARTAAEGFSHRRRT